MSIDLSGKVALVTASTAGIGFAIARLLLECGASVAICGRDQKRLDVALESLAENQARLVALMGDIAEPAFLESFVAETTARFGTNVGVLVNNSGGPPPGDALQKSDNDWKTAIDTNFMSVVRMCRLVVPLMKKRKWGRIINLTSTAAREPAPGMILSNATRAAVAAYSKTLAHELGPFGITVNTILTGGCLTDRLNTLLQTKIAGTGQTMEQAIQEIENTIPVRHLATPDEFARIVLFLTSPEAAYVNGAAIPIDGGSSKSLF